jgi:hypothetical protein
VSEARSTPTVNESAPFFVKECNNAGGELGNGRQKGKTLVKHGVRLAGNDTSEVFLGADANTGVGITAVHHLQQHACRKHPRSMRQAKAWVKMTRDAATGKCGQTGLLRKMSRKIDWNSPKSRVIL